MAVPSLRGDFSLIPATGGPTPPCLAQGASLFSQENRALWPAASSRRKNHLDETTRNFFQALADTVGILPCPSTKCSWFRSASACWAFPVGTPKPPSRLLLRPLGGSGCHTSSALTPGGSVALLSKSTADLFLQDCSAAAATWMVQRNCSLVTTGGSWPVGQEQSTG